MAVATHEPAPPLPRNPEVPPELSDLVMRLLAKRTPPSGPPRPARWRRHSALEKALPPASGPPAPWFPCCAGHASTVSFVETGPPCGNAPARSRRSVGLLLGAGLLLLLAGLAVCFGPRLFRSQDTSPAAGTGLQPVDPIHTQPKATVVNLLSLIDPKTDTVAQEWTFNEKGELLADARGDENGARLQIPYRPAAEYDASPSREPAAMTPATILVGRGRQVEYLIAGYGNTICGFDNVDGKDFNRNPTTRRCEAWLQNGRRYEAVFQVRQEEVKVFLDEEQIADLKTNYSNLGVEKVVPEGHDAPGLGDVQPDGLSQGRGRRDQWFRHAPRSGKPKGNKVNLVPLIDPKADAVFDTWSRNEKGELLSGTEVDGRLQFPYRPPAEYDLRIGFTRLSGEDTMAPILVGGGRQIQYFIAGFHNTICGFDNVNGKDPDDNPTTRRREAWLQNGRRYEVLFQVRILGVKVWLDGQQLADFKTDYSNLYLDRRFTLKDNTVLGLGTHTSRILFHQIEVVEISGPGTVTRPGRP